MKILKMTMISFLIFILVFIAYVRYLESKSVFHPEKDISATPPSVGLNFEDIYFKTKDQLSINGWLIKNPQATATLIYLHGNAGNMANRLEKIKSFINFGLNVFIIDYRGYGKSQGHPSERGIYEDAVSAYDYLLSRKDIISDGILAYGGSLGGVVAIDLATKRNLSGLIIDSSFSSAADMGKAMYPFIPSLLLMIKMDSATKVKNLTIPKLFIHSPEDDVVPFRLGQKLFEAAALPKEFLRTKGKHNDRTASSDIWIEGVGHFLKQFRFIQ